MSRIKTAWAKWSSVLFPAHQVHMIYIKNRSSFGNNNASVLCFYSLIILKLFFQKNTTSNRVLLPLFLKINNKQKSETCMLSIYFQNTIWSNQLKVHLLNSSDELWSIFSQTPHAHSLPFWHHSNTALVLKVLPAAENVYQHDNLWHLKPAGPFFIWSLRLRLFQFQCWPQDNVILHIW